MPELYTSTENFVKELNILNNNIFNSISLYLIIITSVLILGLTITLIISLYMDEATDSGQKLDQVVSSATKESKDPPVRINIVWSVFRYEAGRRLFLVMDILDPTGARLATMLKRPMPSKQVQYGGDGMYYKAFYTPIMPPIQRQVAPNGYEIITKVNTTRLNESKIINEIVYRPGRASIVATQARDIVVPTDINRNV